MAAKGQDERVMVFPAEALNHLGYFQGLTTDTEQYVDYIFDPANYKFRKRSQVEEDASYKQIVAYVILAYQNKILAYRRGKLGGETRLHGNYSIGIGGHVSESDVNLFDPTLESAVQREVAEELLIETKHTSSLVALLNDDANAVGKVHLGAVYLWRLEEPSVRPRERAITDLRFWNPELLRDRIDEFENWSQICIRYLDDLITR